MTAFRRSITPIALLIALIPGIYAQGQNEDAVPLEPSESEPNVQYIEVTKSLQTFLDAPSKSGNELYRAKLGEVVKTTSKGASVGQNQGYWLADGVDINGKMLGIFTAESGNRRISDKAPALRAFLDLSEGQTTTIYSEPGKTWKDCEGKTPNPCQAWVQNDAELSIVDAKFVEIRDPFTDETRLQNFYQVQYTNGKNKASAKRSNSRTGWISAEFVSTKPIHDFIPVPGRKPECPEPQPPVIREESALEQLTEATNDEAFEETLKQIRPLIGRCLVQPVTRIPDMKESDSVFDALVMPQWKGPKSSKLAPSGKITVSKDDLMSIDALARTIYGEMANCWGGASHYLEAVAAVVKNREEFITVQSPSRRSLFATEKPDKSKTPLVEVLSKKKQFSVWNSRDGKGAPNRGLGHVLCPPSDPNAKFWKGHTPGKTETAIWEDTLRVAAKAVLKRKTFSEETSNVRQYYYTSGVGKFFDFKRVTPSIKGAKLTSERCIEIWHKDTF